MIRTGVQDAMTKLWERFTRRLKCPHCGKRLGLFPAPKVCPGCGRAIYDATDRRRRH